MDPSQASVSANQPEQTETITCMDRDSYNAAAEGKIEVFKDIIDHESLGLLLTPNKNTILHIYITALNSGSDSTTNFVEEILEMCPSLLHQANAKGETPLHIAARYGHSDIVEVLIKYCAQTLHDQDLENGIEPIKEMFMMVNKEKDTALHEAVRYNHLKVVELLIKQDPDFSYSANDADETPLYMAAERGFASVLFEILDKCKSPMHGGPLGRTTLHAALIQNNKGMVGRILEKIDGISRKVDNNGWTPLHLAAYYGRVDIAKQLLDKDRKVAYMKDTEGRTPLHIAAHRGWVGIIKVIVKRCPDCCELVDNRGWNVLHFAINGERAFLWLVSLEDIIAIIIKNWSFSNLLNEKNANGDTPLHFYATSSVSLELDKFVSHPRLDRMAFNKQHLNAWDIASTNHKKVSEFDDALEQEFNDALDHFPPQRVITYEVDTTKLEDKKEREENEKERRRSLLQKTTEIHLLVATLIATVTFAACITMPGGFVGGEGSHPGSVLLRRKASFKAFVITDTISMVLSSSAVFIHLLIPFLSNSDNLKLAFTAFKLILWAMIAMGLAFVTGTYAVLTPSLDLAIANGIIGLTFFAIFFSVFLQLSGASCSVVFEILFLGSLTLM